MTFSKMRVLLLLLSLSNAFAFTTFSRHLLSLPKLKTVAMTEQSFDPLNLNEMGTEVTDKMSSHEVKLTAALTALFVWLGPSNEAFAKDGAYGILEGRTVAMVHPISMLALFGVSVYAGYLGLQWRQLREVGNEIRALSQQLPTISSGKVSYPISKTIQSIKELIAAQPESASVLQSELAVLQSSSIVEIDSKIGELTATRKDLQSKDLRDKHWALGSLLLGGGVCISILGGLDTYFRAGKLFPGPHLFAGLGITGLWAAASALIPAMQKGNDSARAGHIALNSVNVALFAWQVYTGLDIMVKVWGFTKWP